MLAAVFLMQPVGQLFAAAAGWLAVYIVNTHFYDLDRSFDTISDLQDAQSWVDQIWRGVVGFGAIPALVALGFRILLKDPGRWTLEVKKTEEELNSAERVTKDWQRTKHVREEKKKNARQEKNRKRGKTSLLPFVNHRGHPNGQQHESVTTQVASSDPPVHITEDSLSNYLFQEKNWPLLAGTAGCWALLDLAFYGLGINSSQILALIWAHSRARVVVPAWNPDPTKPDSTIYQVLLNNGKNSFYTTACSLGGSILLLLIINKINRKSFLAWTFFALFVFLLATGITLRFEQYSGRNVVSSVLYCICQFLFNFGEYAVTKCGLIEY